MYDHSKVLSRTHAVIDLRGSNPMTFSLNDNEKLQVFPKIDVFQSFPHDEWVIFIANWLKTC